MKQYIGICESCKKEFRHSVLHRKTNRKRFCPACSSARYRGQQRDYARKKSRKDGIRIRNNAKDLLIVDSEGFCVKLEKDKGFKMDIVEIQSDDARFGVMMTFNGFHKASTGRIKEGE